MKKLILWLRSYWYIVLVALLFMNYLVEKLTYITELPQELQDNKYSIANILFVKINPKDTITPEQKIRTLSARLSLASYIDSLCISGQTFTVNDQQFWEFFRILATDDQLKKQYQHYYLEDISDVELQIIMKYHNKAKNLPKLFDDKSPQERDLMRRLDAIYQKHDIKLLLMHYSNNTDSTIVVSINPKKYMALRNSEMRIEVVPCAAIVSMFFMLIITLIMLRHVSLKRKYWYLGLLFWCFIVAPDSLKHYELVNNISLFLIFYIFTQLISVLLCFNFPNMLSNRKIWKYLYGFYGLMVVLSGVLNIRLTFIVTVLLILFLIIWQLHKLKGLKKRVMWKWFSISFAPILIIAISFGFSWALLRVLDIVSGGELYRVLCYETYQGDSVLLSTSLVSMIFALSLCLLYPFIAVISALTELSIRFYSFIRRWIVALMIFSGYMSALYIAFIDTKGKCFKQDLVTTYFVLSLGLILTYLIMRVYRYFDAVRHNERKHLRSLLEGSFGISTIDEYFAYYQEVILKLYPKTQIAFISGDVTINDNDNLKLPSLEVLQAIPDTNYFNLDIAIIDGEPISGVFPVLDAPPRKSKKGSVIPQSHEVHLYFPLYNSEHQHLGYLLFGESGKLYWDKENADFLYETVQIFQSFLSSLLLQTQYRNEQLKLEREKQERIFEHQIATEREMRAKEIEEANRRMTDSISYAALIQQSILPNESILTNYLDNYFLLWKPHDVVGGDFFWFCPIPSSKAFLLAMVDCTGHGVPGAFMTIMTNSILNSIVRDRHIYDPAEIIKMLHKEVQYTLQQGHKGSMNDGLDISLILLDPTQQKIGFAGAKHRILHWDATMLDSTLAVYRGGRHSVGGIRPELDISLQEFYYHSGDMIYLFTDGLIDQPILQDKGIKRMTYNGWYEYFYTLVKLEVQEQNATLVSKVNEMLVIHEQIDDITILGIRL